MLTWKYWKSTPVVCSLPPPQKMISVFLSQGAHCEETFSHGFKGCFYAFVFLCMHFQHCMHLYTTHSIKQLTFASVCVCVCPSYRTCVCGTSRGGFPPLRLLSSSMCQNRVCICAKFHTPPHSPHMAPSSSPIQFLVIQKVFS